MNHKTIVCFVALLLGAMALKLGAQGTAFMYQGQLNASGSPASGPYDFRFELYDAVTNGDSESAPVTNLDVTVTSGLFTTTLDFGAVFTGSNYWLDIGVRTNGSTNSFTELAPRQPILPVPYAIFATSASNLLGTLSATQLSGSLPSAQIMGSYYGSVNFTNSTNSFTGTFYGNGSSLSNLNGSQITSGTVADARLSGNVPLLNGSQVFSGTDSFTNRANAFTGSFFGNGLVGWIPVFGTSTQAVANAGYLCLNSNLTTVMLPPTNSLLLGDIVRISGAGSGGWTVAGYPGQIISGNFSSYNSSVWSQASIPASGSWRCLAAAASGVPMYAGDSVGIYESVNGGATWTLLYDTGTSWVSLACSADGTKIYAGVIPSSGGGAGKLYYSGNSGVNWTNIFGAGNFMAVACSANGTNVIAAMTNGASSAVYTSANAGVSSNKVAALAGTATWTAVTSSSDGSRLAAANYGGDLYYALNGSWFSSGKVGNWVSMASSSDGLNLAACANSNVISGSIYTSVNGGANWTQTTATNANWNCLTTSADGSQIVAGINGGVLYGSGNFGATWSSLNTTNTSWACLACSSDGSKVAGGSSISTGQLYYSTITAQYIESTNTNSPIGGGQGTAVELQYIGNSQFMPLSSSGSIWAN